ncbi:type II secretory system protein [Candidatus Scalindua japonica]|uniref:Type II secretory system protein n=1 Tax=Candidatus Scalindua japonica TaxID=1284222 RepID=A0A286U3H3_9BACT|nr:prepilin-type N-terminal cleavage/methylation domain-containing protein [Candidatus Scalindua japonica]GAX62690.1 type II secretory system protein [Candidatus Scalindua japonica]
MNKNNLQCREQAFTLIEMIGVLAIIAILAAVIAPNVIKQMQSVSQDVEEKTLDLLADGLINYVLENRIIPQSGEGTGAWSSNIATQMDLPTNKIYQNDLGNSRRYWFDPATDLNGLSDNSASYNQNTVSATNISGNATTMSVSAPTSPRAMIISDLSVGATNNILVASVGHTASNFAAVWDQTGTLTESSTLKIKRINFSQMFETVSLESSNGSYFARKSYSSPSSSSPIVDFPVLSIEKNSHIFAVHYSTGGFEPTNASGGSATLDIGYTSGGDEFISAASVISGATSGPNSVVYTSTSDISIGTELTISGSGVSNANSGYVDVMIEYNGEPQYRLEGQVAPTTISISSAGTPEIISFNVINGTSLFLYDQSWTAGSPTGDLLHSIVIKESENFAYIPGPPTLWGR